MSIQAVSGMAPGAAAISSTREALKSQCEQDASPARAPKPVRDEYVPEEKREPSGQYWLGRGKDGQPEIFFDDPEEPEVPSTAPGTEKKSGGGKAERCTGNTDAVDREIEQLKKKREELERQLSSETDESKIKDLEQKLAQVERELGQKDNGAYRRRHTVFS